VSTRLRRPHDCGRVLSGADCDVHTEFADVVKRLLALQRVLVAALEFDVVVQLNGARRLVL
jgi:hypothetical protein